MKIKFPNFIKSMIIILMPIVIMMLAVPDKCFQFGLYDDSVRQWLPIMNHALNVFFSTGSMPYYNFFNFEGMEIYDVGYYGLYNPLIWFSFLLHQITTLETVVIYIYLSLIIGNTILFHITKKIINSNLYSFAFIIIYTFNPVLYGHSYWYYIWINYWIIPAFILCFLMMIDDKKAWYIKYMPSFVLICSTLGGNIQYTAYHYLLYFVISSMFFIKYHTYIKTFFLNIGISFVLTLPFLYKLYRASQRSAYYSAQNTDYYTYAVNTIGYVIYSIIPGFSEEVLKNYIIVDSYLEPNRIFQAPIMILFIYFIYIVINKYRGNVLIFKKYSKIDFVATVFSIAFIFFALYLGGKNFIIADFFYYIPFFNKFRFLYKIAFILPGLLILPACVATNKCKHNVKIFNIILVILIATQIFVFRESIYVQTRAGFQYIFSYNYNNNFSHISEKYSTFEKINYRYLLVVPTNDIRFTLTNDMLPFSNMNIYMHMGAVGGYDVAFGKLDKSMTTLYCDDLNGSLNYNNSVSIDMLNTMLNDKIKRNDFVKSLKDNSVRFLLIKDVYSSDLINNISNAGLNIKYTGYDANSGISFYDLTSVPTIVQDDQNNDIAISEVNLNNIFLPTFNDEYLHFKIRYNPNLRAELINNNEIEQLELKEYAPNNVRVDTNYKSGTVHIFYKNTINDLCVFISIIYAILIAVFATLYVCSKFRMVK